ncbi:hypothetical protein, partial [Paenibacillus sp. FSL R7-0337]|uniref:hypothetical protein n=1 Tax=Paenibacillus sp. FSL R7-0337 TaxID=1926588 RepID=UPI001C4B8EA3
GGGSFFVKNPVCGAFSDIFIFVLNRSHWAGAGRVISTLPLVNADARQDESRRRNVKRCQYVV